MANTIYSGIYKKEPKKEAKLFIIGTNKLKMDTELIPYYLWETMAHNYMLAINHLIPDKAAKKILQALVECEKLSRDNKLNLDPEIGDIHENFEHILSQMIGEAAKWFHLARSRNDQITTDQKLITKELFFTTAHLLADLIGVLGHKSIENRDVLMPGFTHLRAAMPSSFGFWFQAYMDQLQEVSLVLKSLYGILDKNPLGAGASYAVNWKINPETTTAYLGFHTAFNNALSAINSRGIHEMYWVGVLSTLMTVISRMMEDLIIFTLPELGYLSVDESYTTGSSIMPQKMNPDISESIRSKSARLLGKFVELAASMKALPSGYNRDSALSKAIIIESFQETIGVLKILTPLIKTVIPHRERMEKATLSTLAINLADFLVKKHAIPFRTAHKIIGKALALVNHELTKIDDKVLDKASKLIMDKSLNVKNSEIKEVLNLDKILGSFSYSGSPNPDFVHKVTEKLLKQNDEFASWLKKQEDIIHKSKDNLLKRMQDYLNA